jgi:hypothetical protein
MIQTMMSSIDPGPRKESYPVLLAIGAPVILISSLLAWRIVWEETAGCPILRSPIEKDGMYTAGTTHSTHRNHSQIWVPHS